MIFDLDSVICIIKEKFDSSFIKFKSQTFVILYTTLTDDVIWDIAFRFDDDMYVLKLTNTHDNTSLSLTIGYNKLKAIRIDASDIDVVMNNNYIKVLDYTKEPYSTLHKVNINSIGSTHDEIVFNMNLLNIPYPLIFGDILTRRDEFTLKSFPSFRKWVEKD